ncbi:hypothetical protein VZ95_06205 [Elstera litoralis]|uniref:CAF17 C-terminal domain-containing protein n=1 Tax=Elstera litoralis TaxID=552518 RepID=A0A0F3IU24_9PROT|nr:folate-binding protein YgfZ [Elstera litoralis]KJV10250.1 hypothetical protein VZ95_06205 [Elstera litoralis]
MPVCTLSDRALIVVTGSERVSFLNGLLTNSLAAVERGEAVYACLLTPQGKFLFDFFVRADGDRLLLEVDAARRADCLRRLSLYKLRADVSLAVDDGYRVLAGFGTPAPTGGIAFADPRHSKLGWRAWWPVATPLPAGVDAPFAPGATPWLDLALTAANAVAVLAGGDAPNPIGGGAVSVPAAEAYHRHRITLGVPDGGIDLEPERSILLEFNLDSLNAIDFQKGCYIGQELTARTKYRAVLKRKAQPVRLDGPVPPPGTPILANGKEAGELRSAVPGLGLALIRLDADPAQDWMADGTRVMRLA